MGLNLGGSNTAIYEKIVWCSFKSFEQCTQFDLFFNMKYTRRNLTKNGRLTYPVDKTRRYELAPLRKSHPFPFRFYFLL